MILDLLLLGLSWWIILPLGIIGVFIQALYPNIYTPYWADTVCIAVGLIVLFAEISSNKRTNFVKHNKEIERLRLEKKSKKSNKVR